MEARDLLRRYPLFAVLCPGSLAAWLASAETRSVELGETLFQAGTPGRYAYLVQSGRVRVLRAAKQGREIVLGTFGPGELFGEYALLPPGLNTATCRVAGAGAVLQLPLESLRTALADLPEVQSHLKRWLRLHAVLGHLRERSFLGFMSATSLLPFLDCFQTVRFAAGQAVQAEGLSTDSWFAILQGRIRVDAAPDDLAQAPAVLGRGDCFGEGALLGRKELPLAEAETDTECMVLGREAFYGRLDTTRTDSLQTRPGVLPSRSYPWVGQQEAADCGLAALAMVARFHGREVSPAALRQRIVVGPRGLSLLELQQAATSLGFRSRAVRVGLAQLTGVALPAIAHLAGEHYVVVYAVPLPSLVIGDPAAGVVTLSAKAFWEAWSGNLLLLTAPGQGEGRPEGG
jgi:CRP-like cAMP-binding protein